MARILNVAESTVKIHVQSILKKLNLTSRVQAAVYAVEHGLGQTGRCLRRAEIPSHPGLSTAPFAT